MAQRYGQNDQDEYRGGRDWNRDADEQGRRRQFEQEQHSGQGRSQGAHSYGGTSPGGYGSQADFGSNQQHNAGQGGYYGAQTGSSRYGAQNQSYSPQSNQQFGEGYRQGNYGQSGYSEGNFGSQARFGEQSRGGYYSQGQSPNPGSHSYGGQFSGAYGQGGQGSQYFGREGYGSQANYGAYGSQGYGGEGGTGAQGYGAQGGYGRYGSQGDYGVPGGYGGDNQYRQGRFGSNAPSEEQLRAGSRSAFSDQVSYGHHAAYGTQDNRHGYGGGAGQSQGGWNPAGQARVGRGARRAPKSYQRSDERLKEDIYERLINRWDLDSTEVTVRVSNGDVTLEGSVPDRRTRHEIENLADDAHGVKEIHNNLRVDQGSSWSGSDQSRAGAANISAAQSGQSSSSGARQGAETNSSNPALSASTVGKKQES
jgi:osmotically-inducible protein OsmY